MKYLVNYSLSYMYNVNVTVKYDKHTTRSIQRRPFQHPTVLWGKTIVIIVLNLIHTFYLAFTHSLAFITLHDKIAKDSSFLKTKSWKHNQINTD